MAENTEEEPPVVNNISNIIFQNDNFELYVEKGTSNYYLSDFIFNVFLCCSFKEDYKINVFFFRISSTTTTISNRRSFVLH
jgi:hypothetical protein